MGFRKDIQTLASNFKESRITMDYMYELVREQHHRLRETEDMVQFMVELHRLFPTVLDVGVDKNIKPYFICADISQYGDDFSVKMFHSEDNFNGRSNKIVLRPDPTGMVYICDIHTSKPSQGYGNALMRALIQYCSAQGYAGLYGVLRPNDDDNRKRLLAFYSKFEFTIETDRIWRPLHPIG